MESGKYILIVAGGSGSRMQSEIPKQFIELCGLPVLMHTIRIFSLYDARMLITVVLPSAQIDAWNRLCRHHRFTVPHRIVAGGGSRFHSVKNGLETLPDKGWVAVHDGVRPLVSHATIDACFRDAERYGNAIPAVPVADTVRALSDDRSRVVDRKYLRLIQTPQIFDLTDLKEAYTQPYSLAFTDDASVLEQKGHVIHLTEGNEENIKITTPRDLKVAEALMNTQNTQK